MNLKNLRTLFLSELQDIYSAEKQWIKVMPKVSNTASNPGLRASLEGQRTQMEGQVTRLEQVFSAIGENAKAAKCEAMAGLIEELGEVIDAAPEGDSSTVDAALICAGQKVAHYEMASYGTLASYADVLGETEAASMLRVTLEEKATANENLTLLAESGINASANRATPTTEEMHSDDVRNSYRNSETNRTMDNTRNSDNDRNWNADRNMNTENVRNSDAHGNRPRSIFVSVPSEDHAIRDRFILKGDAEGNRYVDGLAAYSSDPAWEHQCSDKIKGCDAVIALITKNTYNSKGQAYAVSTARKQNIPVHAFYVEGMDTPQLLPSPFTGMVVTTGSEENIAKFIGGLKTT